MPNPFQYRQYDHINRESIDASGWLALFNATPGSRFYHHPDWFLAIDRHLSKPPLSLSFVEKNGTLVTLIAWQGQIDQRRRATPKHDHLSLGDALIDNTLSPVEQAEAIECALTSQKSPIWDWQMHNIPARSPILAVRQQPSLQPEQWSHRQARTSAWFDLTDETEKPAGKLRRNLKRLHGKLEQEGKVSLQWACLAEELPDAFAQFTTLEASGWKAQGQTSTAIAHNPDLLGFYEQLLSPVYPGLKPVVTLLWLDDRCIAAQYALQTENTLSLLKIAYDENYASFSPGSLLLQKVIATAIDKGLQSVSLVTSPTWADRWHPQTEPVWHVTRYANNAGGLTLRTMDHLKQSARARLKPAA